MTDDPFATPPRQGGMRPAEPMGSDAASGATPPAPGSAPPSFTPQPDGHDSPPEVAGPTPPAPPAPPMAPGSPAPQYSAYPPAANPYPKTWMNITALVTSLVGIGLAGIIFGHLGVAAAKRGEAQYRGAGIAGFVLGYLQVLAAIIAVGLFVVAFAQGTTTTN